MTTQTRLQEIFDITLNHLRLQKVASFVIDREEPLYESPVCLYRDQNGLKCAAGVHIPDDAYTPEMEGKSIRNVAEVFLPGRFTRAEVDLMAVMQSAHDRHLATGDTLRWELSMRDIASLQRDGPLTYTPL